MTKFDYRQLDIAKSINEDLYVELKKHMRNNERKKEEAIKKGREFVFGDCVSYASCIYANFDEMISKYFFPRFFTEDEEETLYDMMEIKCVPHDYDCSGQVFTQFIKFYKTANGTWVYHTIGRDV